MISFLGKFPHNFRNISRIVFVIFILGFFVLFVIAGRGETVDIEPARNETFMDVPDDIEQVRGEIKKTLEVLEKRPDYATAWLRLSVLYEQLGDEEMAKEAKETARKLRPEL